MAKKKPLGRGLGALIADAETKHTDRHKNVAGSTGYLDLPLTDITPNPSQPRSIIHQETLEELATSIRQYGVIQPITVREVKDTGYQIISGERRYKASLIAGLDRIPAFVRKTDDGEMLELALVENIQREDMDAIDIAITYERLIAECQLTQEMLSERVGKKRSTITNYLRLLKLPDVAQKLLRENLITMGHARALIGIEDETVLITTLEKVVTKRLSVRETEKLVQQAHKNTPTNKSNQLPSEYNFLREHAKELLDRNVKLSVGKNGRGTLSIPFNSKDDLSDLLKSIEK